VPPAKPAARPAARKPATAVKGSSPAATAAGKPKVGSLKSPYTWLIIGGIALVGGAIILLRKKGSSTAATTATTAGTTDAGTAASAPLGAGYYDSAGSAGYGGSTGDASTDLGSTVGDQQATTTPTGQIAVPNVQAATAAEATTIIKAAGLHPVNPAGTPGANIVSSTSPAAGTMVASGSDVDINSAPKAAAASSSGGSGSAGSGSGGSGSGGSAPAASAPAASSSTKETAGSWTDTGQKWSPVQLAINLGIPESNLKGSNASGIAALKAPVGTIPVGAKFTFLKP
jgi:hypothetical protein